VEDAGLQRLVVLAIASVMVAAGVWSWREERRRGGDAEGFWTAHRSLSGWGLGMSIAASMLSVSWSLVYGVELFYRWGPGGAWLLAIPWLLVLALFALLAPRLRSHRAFSQGELFGRLYGAGLRRLTVAVLIVVFLSWCGAEIAAAGELLAPIVATPPALVMAAIAALVAAYTWAGGFRSVVVTDVIQFALIVAFFLVVGARALGPAPETVAVRSWWALPGPTPSVIAITLVAYVTGWLAEADIWLRLTAARSDAHARLALAVTGAASALFVIALPALLAARARTLFPDPAALEGPVLGSLLAALLPEGLHVALLGGLAAVALSTVSTTANVVALTAARDGLRSAAGEAGDLRVARWASALAVAAALGVAYLARSLAELFYLSAGLLAAILFWPTLGLLTDRVPAGAVRVGAWTGLTGVVAFFLADRAGLLQPWTPPGVAELGIAYVIPGVLTGAAGFVTGWLRSRSLS